MEDNEKSDDQNKAAMMFFGVLALFVMVFFFFKSLEWHKRSYKTTMAKRYGLSKSEILMNWIILYCPKDIADKYVGNKKHFIRDIDITAHLGKPASYPKDEQGNDISSKSEIAQYLHLSEKTFLRRIKDIKILEDSIGMNLEQYKKQKRFPPKYVNLIIDSLNEQSLL